MGQRFALLLLNAGARLDIKNNDYDTPHSLLEKLYGQDYWYYAAEIILNIHNHELINDPHQNLALVKGLYTRKVQFIT